MCTFTLGVQVGAGATEVVSDAADDVSAGWAASTGAEEAWVGSAATEEELSTGSAASVGCSAAVEEEEEEELESSSEPPRTDPTALVRVPMVDSTHSVTSPAQPRTRLAMSEE